MRTITRAPFLNETTALDIIRELLDDEEWVAGDVLPTVASVISSTGRPNPIDHDVEDAPYPLPTRFAPDSVTAALDEIAVTLGDEPNWNSDTINAVWASVAATV